MLFVHVFFMVLPTFRCGFDLHFQMYLLKGLVQWNGAHVVAAVEGGSRKDIYYGGQLQQSTNILSQQFMGINLDYTSPGKYTGNMFVHKIKFCVVAVTPAFHPCAYNTSNVYR